MAYLENIMSPEKAAAVIRHLPELLTMARCRHADELISKDIDISFCGMAKHWEECCTIDNMHNHVQAMLWYNVGVNTHGVALVIKT